MNAVALARARRLVRNAPFSIRYPRGAVASRSSVTVRARLEPADRHLRRWNRQSFSSTDTTAALRAAEMSCDVILKATQVDGIYSADPKLDPDAVRYDRLTYDEALARNLKVMDGAAFALARDSRIPIVVFSIEAQGSIAQVLAGRIASTLVPSTVAKGTFPLFTK